MDFAWAIAGAGPRRWQALGSGAEDEALCLPSRAVRHRRRRHLDPRAPRRSALAILAQLDRDLQRGLAVCGWLGYELGAALEGQASRSPRGWPDAAWFAFDPSDIASHPLQMAFAPCDDPPLPAALLAQREDYCASVGDVLARIAAGEVYQVNLTVETSVPFAMPLEPLRSVSAVMACQPVPLAMAWQDRDLALLSGSMERFLSVRAGEVRSRPIKGTASRRQDAAEDGQQAAWLAAQPKERAENTMIVDMVRNDLQRACHPASVEVPVLLQVEPYATLWHLESEIAGRLRRPDRLGPLLTATLPPASVTGCPKIQAMQVIATREQRRRGPYCGCLGVAWPDGSSDWAVAIRTAWFDSQQAHVAVGAGLVAGSHPEAEWSETCLKARATLRTLAMLTGEAAWR
jgi:para-aminobenzoate synthetase component 1